MKILLRVDDVGRTPVDTPTQGSDCGLEYFSDWLYNSEIQGKPCVCGVVPAWINRHGWTRLRHICIDKPLLEVAMHGYDHQRGDCGLELMTEWRDKILLYTGRQCLGYIPPYNDYNADTMRNWIGAGGKYLYGGFAGHHHFLGSEPVFYGKQVYHIPANPDLYGRSEDISANLRNHIEGFAGRAGGIENKLLVATVHVPWENDASSFVSRYGTHFISTQDAVRGVVTS